MKTTNASTTPLAEMDRPSLEIHFLSLGSEDRRLRFGSALQDESVQGYVARLDFGRDRLYGVHDHNLELVAVVHVAVTGKSAELGLSVLPGWRGQGVGDTLFRRAVDFLRNHGVHEVFVHCLAENGAMLHLARRNEMRVVLEGGEGDAHLVLEPPDAQSFYAEWLANHQGHTVRALRAGLRSTRRVLALFDR